MGMYAYWGGYARVGVAKENAALALTLTNASCDVTKGRPPTGQVLSRTIGA